VKREEIKNIIECLLFTAEKPLAVSQLSEILEISDEKLINNLILELQKEYENRSGGLVILALAGGYKIYTRKEYADWVKKLYKDKTTLKLSRPALEVLSIIAYKQPVTRAEIEQIRGVDSSGTIWTLLQKRLIRIGGRRNVPGRPLLYKTTPQFLERFGLRDLSEIPRPEELTE